jgi:hypothetical protein
MIFNRKQKLIFHSSIEGMEKIMPIIPSKNYRHGWKTDAIAEFNENKKDILNKASSMARCPGINLIQKQGWIVRSWQDVVIETNEENEQISWCTPIDQKSLEHNDFISFHSKEMFKHIKNYPLHTVKSVIKFNTGWKCKIPRGYILYQLPIAHNDENRFTTISGCYTCDTGIATLNVPVYWHILDGKVHLPAGTPLCQLILVPDQTYDYEISKLDSSEIRATYLALNNQFVSYYNNIKQYWSDK